MSPTEEEDDFLYEMKISTYAAWLIWEEEQRQRDVIAYPDLVPYGVDAQRRLDQERNELLVGFPCSVVVVGSTIEHDYAARWCWQNIGPRNGSCWDWQSEFPACPLVLETERLEQITWTDKSGNVIVKDRKRYANPGEHRHEGEWSFLFFGKTGYDYGYGEYYFANEQDRASFVTAFPTFTYSEKWREEV